MFINFFSDIFVNLYRYIDKDKDKDNINSGIKSRQSRSPTLCSLGQEPDPNWAGTMTQGYTSVTQAQDVIARSLGLQSAGRQPARTLD
jgi:hypothetical protein